MESRPKLRYVEAFPVDVEGQRLIYLRDPEGYAGQGLAVPIHVFRLITLFDGEHSVEDVPKAFSQRFCDLTVTEGQVAELVRQLDEVLLLDSDRFRRHRREIEAAFLSETVRKASNAGASYPDEPEALRVMVDGFFEPPEGPGRPTAEGRGRPVRGLIAPHIDFSRGGACFAWAYGALAASDPPDLFVVLGTGHSARTPFVLTRKDFETPFGPLPADQGFVDRLANGSGADLFGDEVAHRTEHSIEFQTVFLKYLYPERDITFVPILCGSFQSMIEGRVSPARQPEIRAFIDALRDAIAGCTGTVCLIAGVDLSHVGPRFGDPEPLSDAFVDEVTEVDREVLSAVAEVDPDRMFKAVSGIGDRTRICGTSAIYTMLSVLESERGEILKHDRVVDDGGQSLVSFASVAFQ